MRLTIDPVMPQSLDGLAVDLALEGRPVRVVYRVGTAAAVRSRSS